MYFLKAIKVVVPIAVVAIGMLFTSCIKDEKALGGDVIPDDYNLKIGTLRINLPLQTRIVDSVQAKSTEGYVGAIRTPEMGLAEFAFGVNYCPTSLKFNFGKDQIVKTCYIALIKSTSSVADKSQEHLLQNFHIYRMKRAIDTVQIYNVWPKESDYINEPIEEGGLVYAGGDTLRAFLKESFARELLNASQWALDSSYHFIDEFKALLFTCNPPVGNGGRLNAFTVSNAHIVLTINYQPTWAPNLSRRDTTFQFVFGVDEIQNFSRYESKSQQSNEFKEYIGVEGIGGLKPYLDPVKLKDSIDRFLSLYGVEKERFIVARARYYLPYTNPPVLEDINYYYPAYLYPCYKYVSTSDSQIHEYFPVEDVYTEDNNRGLMNRSLGYYYGDISSWVQKLALKEKSEVTSNGKDALWFSPLTATTSSSYYSSSSSTTYSISVDTYVNGRINGPKHANPPYLEIIYTILPKN